MNFRKFERSPLGGKPINNVHLIKNRRINNGNEIKRYFDLMSEDKASRYKMEETSCSLPGTVKSTFLMVFSPDGQRVASTHGDDRIYICDLTSGKLVETLQGHPKTPWCLAWHPVNKEILASGCLGGEVRVWDLRSKACDTWSNEQTYDIASLAFHPTDRILVIATSNELHFWDWSQAKPYATSTTTFDKEKVRFVRFDTSGTKLISGISNLPKIINHNSESLQTGSYQDRVHGGSYQYNNQSSSTHNYARRTPTDNVPQTEQTGNTVSSNFDEQLVQRRDTSVLLRLKLLYQQLERLEESPRHTCTNEAMSRLDVLDIMASSSQYEATATHHSSPKKPMDIKSEINANQPPTTSEIQCDHGTQSANILFNLAHLSKGKWSFLRVTSQDVNMDPFRRENLIRLIQQSNSVDALARVFEGSLQQLASSCAPFNNDMPNTDTQPSTSHQAPPTSDSRPRSIDNQHPLFQLDPYRRRHGRILASLKLYRQTAYRVALSSMNPLQTSQSIALAPPDEIITNPNVMAFGGTTGSSNIPDRLRQRIPAEILANVRGLSNVDPILSIQFRNTVRNVPLSSSCRLDLLCARLTIIMHSQKLLEQMMGIGGHQLANPIGSHTDDDDNMNTRNSSSLFFLLNQLYKTVQNINYSDLVVASAREFVEKSRRRIDRILERLIRISSRFTDVGHIRQQIYFVARHLTSRDCDNPAAESMDDLRLDLIHCLCIVDLTLHFTRQVQFMQVCETRASNRGHTVIGSQAGRDGDPLSPDTIPTTNPTRLNTHSVILTTNSEPSRTDASESDLTEEKKNVQSKRKLGIESNLQSSGRRKRKTTDDDGASKDNLIASTKSSSELKASTSSVSTRSMTKAARKIDDKPKSSSDTMSQHQDLVSNTTQTPSRPSSSTVGHLSCVPSGSRIGIQISSQLPAVVRLVNNLGNFTLDHGAEDGVEPYINHAIRPIGAYISGGMAERLSSSGTRNNSAQSGMVHIVVGVFSPNNNQAGTSAEQLTTVQVQPRTILNNQASGIRLIDRSVQNLQEESEFIIDSGLADVMRVSHPADLLAPSYQSNSNVALQIIQARQRRSMPDVENVIVRDGNMIAVQGAIIYSQQQQQQNEVNNSSHGPHHPRLLNNPLNSRPFSRSNLFGNGTGYPSGYPINTNLNHWWWNSWGIAFSNQTHYRIQCWDFSHSKLPDIKDSSANVVTSKSRIHNDASIDISSDGQLLACLEPQADGICTPPIDFKIYSLNSKDFGTCYYRWSCGPTTRSVSISPLGGYVVVGLTCQKSSFISDISSDTMVIARILKLNGPNSLEHVRDIFINRHDYLMSLNLIKWLPRSGQGLIYGTNRGQLIIARPVSDQQSYVDAKNVDFQL